MSRRLCALALCATWALASNAQDVKPANLQVLRPSDAAPGSTVTPGDFNGDGVSDLLLYEPSESRMAYWLLSSVPGEGVQLSVKKTFNLTKGYFIGAVGDMDGDGKADVVFTSGARDLYLWTNTGQGFRSQRMISYPQGWRLVGSGDVDGDGKDDLLWMNDAAHQFAYWLMNGPVRTGYKVLPVAAGMVPVAVGYFSPARRVSIIWSNQNHQLTAWDPAGATFSSSALGGFPASDHLIAIGGGNAGSKLTVISGSQQSVYFGDSIGNAEQRMIDRTFDSGGSASYADVGGYSGGFAFPLDSAGFFIAASGAGQTGLIYQYGNSRLRLCSAMGRTETNYAPAADRRWLPPPDGCYDIALTRGWFVVGALANGVERGMGQ